MAKDKVVKGFKVFNPDWTCKNKQYACPGRFEEEGPLIVCGHGMHFCQMAVDCFNYYDFDSDNKVAEVIAYGNVLTVEDKSCTDKLEIIREISWEEVLRLVNIGKDCTGRGNTRDNNSGNWNTGSNNSGNFNSGILTPGTTIPETVMPGVAIPEAAISAILTPETGMPGTAIPVITMWGTAMLVMEISATIILGILIPETIDWMF